MIRDLVCAGLGVALAIAYWLEADALPRSLLSDAVGADGLPKLLAVALGGCAVLLGLRAALRRERHRARAWHEHRRPLGVVGLGTAYVLAAPHLGYAPAVALLIGGTIVHFGGRRPLPIAAAAVVGAAVLWLVFARLLGVAMPAGALARWLA